MKVLVIPDVHLKSWMFERAEEIMKKGMAERAVCLMDIPDDWNQEYNLELYRDTFDAAIAFAKRNIRIGRLINAGVVQKVRQGRHFIYQLK